MTAPQKPLIGYMVFDECAEDYSFWDGVISYPNPEGANLAWEKPIKMIEHAAYLELVEAFKKVFIQWDGLGKYKDDDFGEVASVMEDAREVLTRHGIKI